MFWLCWSSSHVHRLQREAPRRGNNKHIDPKSTPNRSQVDLNVFSSWHAWECHGRSIRRQIVCPLCSAPATDLTLSNTMINLPVVLLASCPRHGLPGGIVLARHDVPKELLHEATLGPSHPVYDRMPLPRGPPAFCGGALSPAAPSRRPGRLSHRARFHIEPKSIPNLSRAARRPLAEAKSAAPSAEFGRCFRLIRRRPGHGRGSRRRLMPRSLGAPPHRHRVDPYRSAGST